MNDFEAWNRQVIEEFRANKGKVNGGNSLLLLTTTGAKSGKQRVNPLAYTTDGERLVIIASKGGAPSNPDWYYNVVAHPDVTVEVGGETFEARATVVEGAERDKLYAKQAAIMPNFAEYQEKTTRKIPVIVLTRKS
ncbi:MAG TPA: nitroreductase family deazaflavin-dependent oxidoreductase [Ktedonobacteraceae bacterium]|nr:nitroreductase family deazaflavin-dependent oxidoreductase [Ktedonobacteraceae bacterium]